MVRGWVVNNASETKEQVLDFTVRLATVGLLCALVISWRLFVPGFRVYEVAPVFTALAQIPPFIDWGIFFLCIALLLWFLASPGARIPVVGILVISLFWMLQDINRLHPWNYMYCYTFLIAVLCRNDKSAGLDALRLMICGVYFWAGFHKINVTFFTDIFPWFVAPVHEFFHEVLPSFPDMIFTVAAILTPFFEASIGVLLLFPRWRRLATVMAFTMLMVVLACLGPFGHNWAPIVWPWNVYLFLTECWLFYSAPASADIRPLLRRPGRWSMLSIALFMIAPAFAIIVPWYSSHMGFKLYSGNITLAQVIFSPHEKFSKLPEYIRPLITEDNRLLFGQWAEAEIQVSPYPVPYVFQTSARGLCPYLDDPENAMLVLSYPPPFYSLDGKDVSMPLCPPSPH